MRLSVRVVGRPAPEGSHEVGANGYVMHSSRYLLAWRHAVNRATREAYVAAGLTGDDMPLIPYPLPAYLVIWHVVGDEQCRAEGTDEPTGTPDDDKLLRATIDGLAEARAFGNDSQVTQHFCAKRRAAPGEQPGAYIEISDERLSTRLLAENREIADMGTDQFTSTGEYQLVLSRVGIDGDGDRTWQTVIEVTDTAERLSETWVPAVAARLGSELGAVAEQPAAAAAADKPQRKPRASKATAPPAAAAERPAPAEQVAPAPAAEAPAEPAQPVAAAPAAPAFNPFHRPQA